MVIFLTGQTFTLTTSILESVAGINATINGIASTRALTVTDNNGLDTLTGGSGNDTITGGAGNDRLTGSGGADRFVYGSTVGTNGTDAVTDFNLAQVDNLTFAFNDGGLVNQGALRGNGTLAERLAAGAALGVNTGFVISSANIADAAAAELYAEGLVGENAADIIYLLASTNAAAATAATTTLYGVTYAAAGDAAITSFGTLGNLVIADVVGAQITQFALA